MTTSAASGSIETHLPSCARCREELAGLVSDGTVFALVDADRLSRVWERIDAETLSPPPRPVERLLVRIGVADYDARLLAATPSLRMSWLLGVALCLVFAVAAADIGTGQIGLALFLLIAPLLPVAGVAAAYAPDLDPAYEIGLASPMPAIRLVLVRSVAVLTTTVLMTAVLTPLLPAQGWLPAAWLIPSLALALSSLALMTWLSPQWAALVPAIAWLGLAFIPVVINREQSGDPLLETVLAFRLAGQAGFAALAALAVLVLVRRRNSLELRRHP